MISRRLFSLCQSNSVVGVVSSKFPYRSHGDFPFVNYQHPVISTEDGIKKSTEFYEMMDKRRTIRDFADKEVPVEIIENCIKTAGTSPSGAHKQPWTFVVVTDLATKQKIREATEHVEKANYGVGVKRARMGPQWLKDLEPIGTGWEKEHVTEAPAVIVVFKKMYSINDGKKKGNYYQSESIGIASGFLIAALHNAGLCTLTHTPTPMGYLRDLLGRPKWEKPVLLMPVGYQREDATVPDFGRKPLEEIMILNPEMQEASLTAK